ncbi:MAG TPA: phosphatase PAP2 family protein [Gaiellales bacterium]|nr:phosphatase PAP2 family protein [Gaiellales bacterium]
MAVQEQATRTSDASRADGSARTGRRSPLDPRAVSGRLGRAMAGHPVRAYLLVTLVGFALLAAVTVAAGWALQHYALPENGFGHRDEHVNVWLADHRTGLRTDISFWLSAMGDVYALPALVVLTVLVAAVRRRWRVAAFIVTAIAVEAATYRVVTLVIERQRPHVPRLDDLPVNDSFYSGHTAASVTVYCGIALLLTSWVRSAALRAAIWLVAIAIPLLVALARMYRGMHHPTDVTAGILVGIGCLLIALTAARVAGAAARKDSAA